MISLNTIENPNLRIKNVLFSKINQKASHLITLNCVRMSVNISNLVALYVMSGLFDIIVNSFEIHECSIIYIQDFGVELINVPLITSSYINEFEIRSCKFQGAFTFNDGAVRF